MNNGEAWYIASSGGGGSIVDYSSFIGYQYANEASIPTKPVERGAFVSANKWANPYEVEVELAKYGGAAEIREFLEELERWRESVELVDIVTPSRVFLRANIYRISYVWSMDENGPRMVMPKLSIREILYSRQGAADGGIANPMNAGCADTVTGGNVQCAPRTRVRGLEATP